MVKKKYLYGCSGHAKVILELLEECGEEVEQIVDDNPRESSLFGVEITTDFCGQSPLLVSIGNNAIRKKIVEKTNVDFFSAIHPCAVVSKRALIGEGSVVMAGAILQSEVRVGKHCIVNTGASIDHECVLGDYVHVSPHATLCGDVKVGEGTWIGAGATVIQGIRIGRWCMIAAGSVVTKDIPDGYLAAGNRCKLIKRMNEI